MTTTIYSTLYQFASKVLTSTRTPDPPSASCHCCERGIDHEIADSTNDNIVPTLSMPHGELLWQAMPITSTCLGTFTTRRSE